MGQQQLLLLVLATVIVGIAIAVGIIAFRENSVRSNFDAMTQDAIRIANDLQAWKQKPEMFGGSPDLTKTVAANMVGADFNRLGYLTFHGAGITCYNTRNAIFGMTPTAGGATIEGLNMPNSNYVQIIVTGMADTDIINNITAAVRGGKDNAGSDVTTVPTPAGCTL